MTPLIFLRRRWDQTNSNTALSLSAIRPAVPSKTAFMVSKSTCWATRLRLRLEPNGDAGLADAGGFGEVGADPQPALADGQRLERVLQDRLADAAQAGQDEVLQDDVLAQEAQELLFFVVPARQVRRHVSRSRPE